MPLQPVNDPATDQNFRALEQRFPLGRQNLADESVGPSQISDEGKELFLQLVEAVFGAKANYGLTTGITAGASLEVEHGLGKEPTAVLVSGLYNGNAEIQGHVKTKTSTKFTIYNSSPVLTVPFMWLAIG